MPEAKAAPSASNMGKNKGRACQDRDKPAQIRFSNISAAKGMLRGFYKLFEAALIGLKVNFGLVC